MKILIYGSNFAPELTGIGKYTGEMAEWLVTQGNDVHAVTAPPYYPEWQIDPSYGKLRYTYTIWNGVCIWRSPLYVPARPSGSKRLLHLTSFAFASFPLMLRQLAWRPDVVWVVEPTLFCAPTALLVARLTGAKSWLHVQDFEVDAAFALGILKGGVARRLITRLEGWLMRRFDRVSTISETMMMRALSKGIEKDKLVLFPNWVDLNTIKPMCRSSSYRTELNIPNDATVALYSGNMGSKQGLEIMAQAARLLAAEQDLYFVFCGNGAGQGDLAQLSADLPNVIFMPLQPFERLNELLGMADIHLLPQRAGAADLVMPSKLTGILASGRAVVATASQDSGLGRVVRQCGILVPPEDLNAFAKAIIELTRDPVRRHALGRAGRRYAESHLSIEIILTRFIDDMKKLCNRY